MDLRDLNGGGLWIQFRQVFNGATIPPIPILQHSLNGLLIIEADGVAVGGFHCRIIQGDGL